MTTTKQPQAGEWWQYNGVRIYIAGVKLNGWLLCEYKDGSISQLRFGDWWQHLSECTGWDWQPEAWPKRYVRTSGADSWVYCADDKFTIHNLTTSLIASPADWYWRHGNMVEITEAEALARLTPPETFPQYWTAINDITFAYCERFEPNKYRMVERDGTVMPDSPWYPDSDRDRKQITKEEAEALVKPQESPYDWVEITDPNHVRRGCDWVAGKTGHPDQWFTCRATIGFSQAAWPESRIRCRRKDLPVVPSLVESPDDWVEIDVGVISKPRINIDWMQHKTDKTAGYSDWGPAMVFWTTEIWERHKQDWKVRCRRKDLPVVESPDDWVTQDRVPPRRGIDQVHWSNWESYRWIDAAYNWDEGEIHGYRDKDDDTVVSVRCRRKDLPVTTDDSLAELDTQDDGHLNSYGSRKE